MSPHQLRLLLRIYVNQYGYVVLNSKLHNEYQS